MKDLLRFNYSQLVVLLLFALVFGCGEKNDKWIKNVNVGEALGTSYSIIYLSENELDYQPEIDSIFKGINQSMSTYIPNSDISRINRGDSTVVVDHMFRDVFQLSNEIYNATQGYFDPTVGILVNAWGFGPGKELEMNKGRVDSLLQYVGFNKVKITPDNRIIKSDPNIYFDFNAIAKGYSVDRIGVFLDAKGIGDYLIEVGGELVAKGENKIKEKRWVVAIDDPQMDGERTSKRTVNLKDNAMASSGNYRKFKIDPETGAKYVHTIDPLTGFTKTSNILAVTVVANDCATADAYATAFMAMDLGHSQEILNSNLILEGYIIYLDDAGNVMEYMTDGFKMILLQ
ncbi:FAD:protein FMN transferase [Arenibacter antarcticus]|uniref:FAD:protein FMN transferase n=1 Tax=Arenibacter antarcticus TaxID=2040469 RepID=A0ABW5VDY7_9FLAO|nr:FAD:protein FMN transferase [Arenibacter sp. H213]MCM4168630.1 FAD:protein FMN transferase [Arenibacter sp. H213]